MSWLRRAVVVGNPGEMQIMYGVDGERRLAEFGSTISPATRDQLPSGWATKRRPSSSSTSTARCSTPPSPIGEAPSPRKSNVSPDLMIAILDHLERIWREPDNGIWEVRGPGGTSPFEGHGLGGLRRAVALDGGRRLAEGAKGPLDATDATKYTRRSARRGLTLTSTPSRSTTAQSCSTQAC